MQTKKRNEENVTDAQVRKLCNCATKNCFVVRQNTQIGVIRTLLLVMDQTGVDLRLAAHHLRKLLEIIR